MPPAKKYNVKLSLPTSFLETLPVFATPKPKSRTKKLSAEEKKAAASPASSPAPMDEVAVGKINTGPKELSTAGLTVNSVPQALDKSGKPCRKWHKGPREFKTFSGFKVGLGVWKPQEPQGDAGSDEKVDIKGSDVGLDTASHPVAAN